MIIKALKKGTLKYKRGRLTGAFNTKLVDILKKAGGTKQGKGWVFIGEVPQALQRYFDIEKTKLERIEKIANERIEELASTSIKIGFDVKKIDSEVAKDSGVAVDINLGELSLKYTTETEKPIKDYIQSELETLREKVQGFIINGEGSNALKSYLHTREGMNENKARFIARQETSLLLSEIQKEKYMKAGAKSFRWVAWNDGRTRPLHKSFNGKIFSFDNPPLNEKGEPTLPGQDFGCRCVALPIFDN